MCILIESVLSGYPNVEECKINLFDVTIVVRL